MKVKIERFKKGARVFNFMDLTVFRREDRKYSGLWADGYSDANWDRLAKRVFTKLNSNGHRISLIDFGFGTGNAMDYFERRGFYVEGTEISSHAVARQLKRGRKVYHTSIDDLSSMQDKQFEVGFCNDVIEHIPTELVAPSLEEMARVCSDYLFVSVCPTPSNHLSLEGENLHLTIRPLSWWEDQFRNYGDVEKLRLLFSRSARYAINLKSKTPSKTSPARLPLQNP